MDNSLQRKQIWSQSTEVLFSRTDRVQMQALRGLSQKHWMTENWNLRALQSSRRGVASHSLQTRSWALFHSVAVNRPVIVLAVGKSFIPPLETSARNSQQWDLQTSFRTSSLAFAGDGKELVSSTAGLKSTREDRVQKLAVLPLWVTAASKTKQKV